MSLLASNRRKFLKMSVGGILCTTFLPSEVFASLSNNNTLAGKNNSVSFKNLHTGERLETQFMSGDQFNQTEMNKINHIFRDFRQNEVHDIDPLLLLQLTSIQSLLKTNKEVHIISGYRSPVTNEMLRSGANSQVAKKSFHMLGKAIDFNLEGVPLDEIRDAAKSLKSGGVGYYPNSNFLHIDTGSVRSW